jgi:hypothetical protein
MEAYMEQRFTAKGTMNQNGYLFWEDYVVGELGFKFEDYCSHLTLHTVNSKAEWLCEDYFDTFICNDEFFNNYPTFGAYLKACASMQHGYDLLGMGPEAYMLG